MDQDFTNQSLREVSMRKVTRFLLATTVGVLIAGSASAQVTVFEGARMIVGDGRVVDNATLVVDGARIVQAGAGVQAPAGATRVNLAGKTVMPMIIDTHVHLSTTREKLIRDLRARAYWGVSAVSSMGTDGYEVLGVHNDGTPGAARYLSAARGRTTPQRRRTTAPH